MTSPYIEYQSYKEWEIIRKSINDLVENNDIQITTLPDYVVGYITKQFIDNKVETQSLYNILEELDKANIHYKLERYRGGTVMICVTVVGSRIEIEVFKDGSIETNIFKGDESLEEGIDVVNKIIAANRD